MNDFRAFCILYVATFILGFLFMWGGLSYLGY